VAKDHVAQVLVRSPEKAWRLPVTQESAEQFSREPYKAIFVDRIFYPSGYEDAKQRLVVGGRCIGAKERVSRIADGATPAAQPKWSSSPLIPALRLAAAATCGWPAQPRRQRVGCRAVARCAGQPGL